MVDQVDRTISISPVPMLVGHLLDASGASKPCLFATLQRKFTHHLCSQLAPILSSVLIQDPLCHLMPSVRGRSSSLLRTEMLASDKCQQQCSKCRQPKILEEESASRSADALSLYLALPVFLEQVIRGSQ